MEGKEADVQFDILFQGTKVKKICKAVLGWIKEKKWYIQKIKIFSCDLKNEKEQ